MADDLDGATGGDRQTMGSVEEGVAELCRVVAEEHEKLVVVGAGRREVKTGLETTEDVHHPAQLVVGGSPLNSDGCRAHDKSVEFRADAGNQT